MSNKTIVITRPSGQARQLSEAMQASLVDSGFTKETLPQIISLPLLTIAPKGDGVLLSQITAVLKTADLAIFVSPNAIECTMRLVEQSWQDLSGKPVPIGVMGGSSMAALKNHGIGIEGNPTTVILPQNNTQWDSEGLWEVIQNRFPSWAGRRVVVFRGDSGREWLADQLQSVGAQVEAIAVYSRVPLSESSPQWEKILNANTDDALWILTSSEAVRHLGTVLELQGRQDYLAGASALCPHHNIAHSAHEIGFRSVLECHSGDAALVSAAIAWLEAASKKPH